jgi:hypothetical protein
MGLFSLSFYQPVLLVECTKCEAHCSLHFHSLRFLLLVPDVLPAFYFATLLMRGFEVPKAATVELCTVFETLRSIYVLIFNIY